MSRYYAILLLLLFANAGVGHSQWVTLHPAILNYSTQNNKAVRAIHCEFVNKDSGYILTSKGLAVTMDGGETWSLDTTTPGYPSEMKFTSFNNGWIEGDPSYIYRTTDRGSHWELDSNRLISVLGSNAGYSLYFRDSLHGWQGSSDVSIFATTDGGRTWHSQNSDSNYPSTWVSNIAFCNDHLGIALGNYEFEMMVLRTTDGGSNWEKVPYGSNVMFFPDGPSGLAYTDPHHAWFSTANDGLFLSTDSGLTWSSVFVPGASIGSGIQAISFADSNHGLVLKRNVIDSSGIVTNVVAFTIDGGLSWDTTVFNDLIWDASFPDTSGAYVCSYYNLYSLTTADLAVQQMTQVSTGVFLESEAGNLFIVMPQNSGGHLRIMDMLGRVMDDEVLLPGARKELSSSTQNPPQFRFAEVECDGQVQVFKLLQ